jgi:hypothetical protein
MPDVAIAFRTFTVIHNGCEGLLRNIANFLPLADSVGAAAQHYLSQPTPKGVA